MLLLLLFRRYMYLNEIYDSISLQGELAHKRKIDAVNNEIPAMSKKMHLSNKPNIPSPSLKFSHESTSTLEINDVIKLVIPFCVDVNYGGSLELVPILKSVCWTWCQLIDCTEY